VTIAGDVEGRQPPGEGLSDHQPRAVRSDHHAVGKVDVAGDVVCRALGIDQPNPSRLGGTAPEKVEVGAVEVDAAGRIDDELIPALGAMTYGGAVRLDPSEFLTGDQEPAVGQPIDGPTHPGAASSYHLASTVHVDGHHFAATPVREPQAALMPTGRLDHREALGQQSRSRKHDGHGAHSTRAISERIRSAHRPPR